MSRYDYPPYPYQNQAQSTPSINHDLFKSMATGATVGAAAATAAQLHRPAQARHNPLGEILKAGAVTGLTVGAVSLVQQNLGCEKKLSTFAAMFITGTAIMYALHSAAEQRDEIA